MKKLLFGILLIPSITFAAPPVYKDGDTISSSYPILAEGLICKEGTNVRALACDSTGALLPGTEATSLGKAEDAAHTSGDTGVMALGVAQNPASATTFNAIGDYGPIALSQNGSVYTQIDRRLQASDATGLLKAEDAAHSTGDAGVFVMGVVNENNAFLCGAEGDYCPLSVSRRGIANINSVAQSQVIADQGVAATVKYAKVDVAGADADIVIAAVAAKKFRVLGYSINCGGATNLTFEDGDGTDVSGPIPLVANGNLGVTAAVDPIGYFQTPVVDKALSLLKSAAVSCGGHITYIEVD